MYMAMFMLAVLDMLFRQERILRRVATRHALTASLATLLIGTAAFFILADIDARIGWVGVDSLVLLAIYVVGVQQLRSANPPAAAEPVNEAELEGVPRMSLALAGFFGAAGVLALVTPQLVNSSAQIAAMTGLGTGFVGTTLVALVTSLPELVTTITAVRIGAYDLAVGNLFGSNAFNVVTLSLSDFFFTQGRFLGAIDPAFALVALLGLILTSMGLIGNLARLERRLLLLEVDALAILLVYFGGLWFLYARGIGV